MVVALPPRARITDRDPTPGTPAEAKLALLLAGEVSPIRDVLAAGGRAGGSLTASRVEATTTVRLPTDDWPFVYLRSAGIPSHNLRMWAILALLSLFLGRVLRVPSPASAGGPRDAHFFWLGAGFLLLETAGIVRLAVLFGTTWVTSSIAFGAILVMAFLANACVGLLARIPTTLLYAALAAALVAFAAVPATWIAPLPLGPRIAVAGCWLALPVFCSGLVFARALAASAAPARALGANIAGAVAGAALETLSAIAGYRALAGIVFACYAASALALAWSPRRAETGS